MILKSIHIRNFKSISDSDEFTVSRVTSLVGKNESGKTAVLHALEKLKPVVSERGDFRVLEEFPRTSYLDYTNDNRPKEVVHSAWTLEEHEVQAINDLIGCEILEGPGVNLEKGYDNTLRWGFNVNHSRASAHLIEEAGLYDEEKNALSDVIDVSGLIKTLSEVVEPSPRQTELLAALQKKFPGRSLTSAIYEKLRGYLPYFVYFGNYESMPGQVAIDALMIKDEEELTMPERIFLALLRMAGTSTEELKELQDFETLRANLEAISTKLSREIFRFWSQNRNLKIEFDYRQALPKDPAPFNTGFVFRTRVRNTRHDVTVPFDERSTGFVWFFSFLVWFSQAKAEYGSRLILLLDEPGLNLHAKAQADLLRYIDEKLAPEHQVIYTTHSPFMIDPNKLTDVRTVEDVVRGEDLLGTKVSEEILRTDKDTIFPLQAALGYEITQTLFIGEHTLLVEGPGDVMTLQWASEELRRRGREALDRRWVVAPTGGIDKISPFVALFGGNKLHVAAFTDYAQGDKNKIQRLRESELLRQGHVFTATDLVDQPEADTEDVLGRPLYIALVNACYNLSKKHQLPTNKPKDAPIRVVKEVEAHFGVLPATVPEFDHYTPAVYLLRNADTLRDNLPELDEALERFEILFRSLNALV